MTQAIQKKGRLHIDYIKEIAISYWAKLNFTTGMYSQCLRDAMKEHREYIVKCENERRRIARMERKEAAMKCAHCFTPLDQNDIFHYGFCCRDCFHAKMNGEFRRDDYSSIPPRIVKPRLPNLHA